MGLPVRPDRRVLPGPQAQTAPTATKDRKVLKVPLDQTALPVRPDRRVLPASRAQTVPTETKDR